MPAARMADVVAVAACKGHGLGKTVSLFITLITGQGVAGDAHCGETVKHRSRVAKDPLAPNLRQVHVLHAELLDALSDRGFSVHPGELGENILTRGLDVLALPEGTELAFASGARIRLTGLRNPCAQINGHTPGLMDALIERTAEGGLIRKGGVMGIVLSGGDVRAGDAIRVCLPEHHRPLLPV